MRFEPRNPYEEDPYIFPEEEEVLALLEGEETSDRNDKVCAIVRRLVEAAALSSTPSAANAREKKLTEALEKIDAMCPPMPPHPGEGEYDFSSAYFNTSDDYAYHVKMRAKAAVGDIARAALQAPAQDGETK